MSALDPDEDSVTNTIELKSAQPFSTQRTEAESFTLVISPTEETPLGNYTIDVNLVDDFGNS